MPEKIFQRLSSTMSAAQTTEELTRPLLTLLEKVTGLESTYLTRVDIEAGIQSILFSRNSKKMQIPEGLSVPWEDTLCKRALEEGRPITENAGECWGDSNAARALGICTYVSTPIYKAGGDLFGTLCAASTESHSISPDGQHLLALFGSLIQQQIQREDLLARLTAANQLLEVQSLTDVLTDLPNRRGIFEQLHRMFAIGVREQRAIYVAFIDLDGFKQINDQYGHDEGDAFLLEVGRSLSNGLRDGDLLGRLGGDEFIVAVLGEPLTSDHADRLEGLSLKLGSLLQREFQLNAVTIGYPGASVGAISVDPASITPQAAVQQADQAMYMQKNQRRARGAPLIATRN